jgi:hypothetical protein
MEAIKITVVEDAVALSMLAKKWDILLDSLEKPVPFLSHAWVTHWWANFNNGNALYIITVWKNDNLLGILPLQKTICMVLNVFRLRCLQSLVNGQCSLSDVIAHPDNLDCVLKKINEHFTKCSSVWDLIMMGYVPIKNDVVIKICNNLKETKIKLFVEPIGRSFESYYLDIKGSFQDYFSGLNKSFKDNRRNINNRLQRKGTMEFEVLKHFDPDAVQQFINLEGSGWKNEKGTSIRLSKEVNSFYREIAETFAGKGQFLLAILRLNGSPIASIYGLIFKNIFYFLKIGINDTDPEIKKLSPGQVILYHLIKYCFDEKIEQFDFCAACYFYESHWTKTVNQKKTIMIFNTKKQSVKLCVVLKRLLVALKLIENRIRSRNISGAAKP